MDITVSRSSRITSPRLLQALQVLFGLNAFIWLASYLTRLAQLRQAGVTDGIAALVITGLMGGSAIAMLLAGLCLSRRCKLYLYFTAGVVLTNIMLAVIDQVGLFNPLTLLIDVMILALLPMLDSEDIPVS